MLHRTASWAAAMMKPALQLLNKIYGRVMIKLQTRCTSENDVESSLRAASEGRRSCKRQMATSHYHCANVNIFNIWCCVSQQEGSLSLRIVSFNRQAAHPRFFQMISSGPGAGLVIQAERSWWNIPDAASLCRISVTGWFNTHKAQISPMFQSPPGAVHAWKALLCQLLVCGF